MLLDETHFFNSMNERFVKSIYALCRDGLYVPEAHRSMKASDDSSSLKSQRMSAYKHEYPFSANVEANVVSLRRSSYSNARSAELNEAHPREDCGSSALQLTRTSGVGASR